MSTASLTIGLLNGLAWGVLLFTVAAGLTLLFGLLDVLNLAHGAVFLLGSYLFVSFVPIGLGAAAGAVIGAALVLTVLMTLALRPVANRGHLDQALLTLGIAYVLKDVFVLVWGKRYLLATPPGGLGGSVTVGGVTYPVYRIAATVIGLVLALGLYLAFERTTLGAKIRATVENPEIAAAMGVRVKRVRYTVLAAGLLMGVLGGAVAAPILGVGPGVDNDVLLLALLVIVIGGLGSLKGALVGALIVGTVNSLGVAIAPKLASFFLFGVMAAVLIVRPTGLFGETSR